jgi:tripeptidyl-peptidase-2
MQSEYPTHLQLMVEILQKVAGAQGKEEPKFSLVIDAADAVISLVETDSLARHFSMKSEAEDPDAAQVRKEMEKQRDALADALYRKGLALIQQEESAVRVILCSSCPP